MDDPSFGTVNLPELAESFLFLREGQRHLSEAIAPSAGRPHIGVTEPDRAVKGLALVRSLDPSQRGHHCRIAPHSTRLRAVGLVLFLIFVRAASGAAEDIVAADN